MRYESPIIVRREQIKALLTAGVKSDLPDSGDTNVISDVNVKEHIRPVVWSTPDRETVPYAKPSIINRDAIAGLLRPQSDPPEPDTNVISDVNVKEHIRPVVWSTPDRETVPYARPSIINRDAIAGLLINPKSDPKTDGFDSDVNVKDNVVPVRW